MIAVIVPAHNEEQHLEHCVRSLATAAASPALANEDVLIIVVLDDCTDASARVVDRFSQVTSLPCHARNVGTARALGARHALAAGARWLAFTDADSEVAPDWIAQQLRLKSDAVCGTVQVRDWETHGGEVRSQFHAFYQDRDGHRHIHGANLGVAALAYDAVGGFAALATGEDVALVRSLEANGLSIAWTAAPRVTTSARKHFRAPGGFGATLLHMAHASTVGGETIRTKPGVLG